MGQYYFFFIFTVSTSLLTSLNLGTTMFAAGNDIHAVFEDGTIPEITIRNGITEVEGRQPIIIADEIDESGNRIYIAVDTTGKIKSIDENRYYQGFLLTKTELHVLNNDGRYNVIPLSDLHDFFNTDPIIINAETTSRGWRVFSVVVAVLFFIFLVLWNLVVRLMFISVIALVLWGVISLFQTNAGFGPIINSGLYALIPAVYIHHLFSRSEISFFGFQTLLFMMFWVIALFISLAPLKFLAQERPLRLWRALIGLPLLAVMTVDTVTTFKYGDIASWVLMLLTVIILAIVGVIPLGKEMQITPPAPVP